MKKIFVCLLIFVIATFLTLPVIAAAGSDSSNQDWTTYEDGSQAVEEAAARNALSDRSSGLPEGRVTYILKEIPQPESTMNNVTFRGFVNFDPSLSITSINIASAAAHYNYIRGYNGGTHTVNIYVGDYITLDPDWTVTSTAQTLLDTYFEVVEWMPDQSSPFNNIRSTLSHYLFNDDFTNVPFGTGWIDLFSTAATIMLFVLPVLVIFGLCKFFWNGLTYGN